VIGILGGLTAALCWGLSTVVASRSTRILGSQQALAYVMLLGLVALLVVTPATGLPAHAGPRSYAWAVLAGVGSTAGLSMMYRALRLGKVGVVAPIASTEGALAALFAVAEVRDLQVSAAFTISDSLADLVWNPQFHGAEVQAGLITLYGAAVSALQAASPHIGTS